LSLKSTLHSAEPDVFEASAPNNNRNLSNILGFLNAEVYGHARRRFQPLEGLGSKH